MTDKDNKPATPPTETSASAKSSGSQQRVAVRDSLFLQATIRLPDGTEFLARVRNLSTDGMMIESDAVPSVGTVYEVEMRGIGRVSGRVAWVAEGRAGLALDSPIDPKAARKPVARKK